MIKVYQHIVNDQEPRSPTQAEEPIPLPMHRQRLVGFRSFIPRRYHSDRHPEKTHRQIFGPRLGALRSSNGPVPHPPPRMVEEPQGGRSSLGKLMRKIFGWNNGPGKGTTQRLRQQKLENIGLGRQIKFLHTNKVTNILYWYCIDLSFQRTDFERLLPDKSLRVGSYDPKLDEIKFEVKRARNPINLTKWMGYFLEFESKDAALVYYQETLGSELCGMPLRLRFVESNIRGLHSPLLDKVPGLNRRCHALILGLPYGYSELSILRVLWDYDLIDGDKLSVEKVPVDKVRYGGNPFLLRFRSEEESERFVNDYHNTVFPYSESKVFCEVVD